VLFFNRTTNYIGVPSGLSVEKASEKNKTFIRSMLLIPMSLSFTTFFAESPYNKLPHGAIIYMGLLGQKRARLHGRLWYVPNKVDSLFCGPSIFAGDGAHILAPRNLNCTTAHGSKSDSEVSAVSLHTNIRPLFCPRSNKGNNMNEPSLAKKRKICAQCGTSTHFLSIKTLDEEIEAERVFCRQCRETRRTASAFSHQRRNQDPDRRAVTPPIRRPRRLKEQLTVTVDMAPPGSASTSATTTSATATTATVAAVMAGNSTQNQQQPKHPVIVKHENVVPLFPNDSIWSFFEPISVSHFLDICHEPFFSRTNLCFWGLLIGIKGCRADGKSTVSTFYGRNTPQNQKRNKSEFGYTRMYIFADLSDTTEQQKCFCMTERNSATASKIWGDLGPVSPLTIGQPFLIFEPWPINNILHHGEIPIVESSTPIIPLARPTIPLSPFTPASTTSTKYWIQKECQIEIDSAEFIHVPCIGTFCDRQVSTFVMSTRGCGCTSHDHRSATGHLVINMQVKISFPRTNDTSQIKSVIIPSFSSLRTSMCFFQANAFPSTEIENPEIVSTSRVSHLLRHYITYFVKYINHPVVGGGWTAIGWHLRGTVADSSAALPTSTTSAKMDTPLDACTVNEHLVYLYPTYASRAHLLALPADSNPLIPPNAFDINS
jgi:hypothetical protein